MKKVLAVFSAILSLQSLAAQVSLEKVFEEALKNAVHDHSVSEGEKIAVLKVLIPELRKHIKFKDNSDAVASLKFSGSRTHYEWRKLGPDRIISVPIKETDRLNGVEARYQIAMKSSSYRTFDNKARKWSKWHPGGPVSFPSNLIVIKKNGKLELVENSQLKSFLPGL